jgi:hypothetical protein
VFGNRGNVIPDQITELTHALLPMHEPLGDGEAGGMCQRLEHSHPFLRCQTEQIHFAIWQNNQILATHKKKIEAPLKHNGLPAASSAVTPLPA